MTNIYKCNSEIWGPPQKIWRPKNKKSSWFEWVSTHPKSAFRSSDTHVGCSKRRCRL